MARDSSLPFLPPRFDGRVLALARRLLPLVLRRSGIGRIEVEGMAALEGAMARFEAGQSRLLLAFRHPSLDDPAVLAHLVWRDLARARRPQGRPAHLQFLYDRGIPLWAGPAVGWLLQRLGGCSIQRGSLDLPALRTARALLLDGPYPLAVAPEGATNGHSEVISPLEPGVAQLAFWTADDLARAGRPQATEVLPIGVQYSFTGSVWPAIEGLLAQLEAEAGLPASPDRSCDPQALYGRLLRLAEAILGAMEAFYQRAHPQAKPPADPGAADAADAADANAAVAARLNRLLATALAVGEQALAVEPHGDLAERCRRLEHVGWERLFPANGPALPSPLERGLAERLAAETEQALWHMRLVESFVAVSGRYVRELPSQERFADTLLILWDTLGRLRGGRPQGRPRLGRRRATLRIGSPLAVAPRLADYRADRRGAVARLTTDLQASLQGLIQPSRPALQPAASRSR